MAPKTSRGFGKGVIKKKDGKALRSTKVQKLTFPQQSLTKLQSAVEDILGGLPKDVTITFQKHGIEPDGGWSGNVYRYNFNRVRSRSGGEK